MAFYGLKGRVLAAERPSFELPKTAFCIAPDFRMLPGMPLAAVQKGFFGVSGRFVFIICKTAKIVS